MSNIHWETGVQCTTRKSEDQTYIEIRTDFIRTAIVDTHRFFMAWAGEHSWSLLLMSSVTTLYCRYWRIIDTSLFPKKFSRRNCSFSEFHNMRIPTCVKAFITLKVIFHIWIIHRTHIIFFLLEMFFKDNISLIMNVGAWEL